MTHQHNKKRSFAPEELNTIEVDRLEHRPLKKPIISHTHLNDLETVYETISKVYTEKRKLPTREITPEYPAKENTQPYSPPPHIDKTISHPDRETMVMKDIAKEKQSIDDKLQNILHHYKEINENEFMFSAHSPVKEHQIRNFLTRLKKEKKERQQRISNMSLELPHEDKHKKYEEKAIVYRKQQIEERFHRRIEYLERNEERRKEEHEKFKEFYRNYKNSKPVHIQMKEAEQEQLAREQKEMEVRLENIAKKYKPISEEYFEEHIRKHQEALQQSEEKKKYEREKFLEQIERYNQKLEGVWKGYYYHQAEYYKAYLKRKLGAPKEKIQKIREYSLEVKQLYMPKTSIRYEKVEDDKKLKTHRYVNRVKYVHGICHGFYEEKLPLEVSYQERRYIGHRYLEQAKKKKKKNVVVEAPYEPTPLEFPVKKKKYPVPRQARPINPLYASVTPINLGSNPSPASVQIALYSVRHRDDKIQQEYKVLRLERLPSVLEYQYRQRAINMKLVRGIEYKLNLLAQM